MEDFLPVPHDYLKLELSSDVSSSNEKIWKQWKISEIFIIKYLNTKYSSFISIHLANHEILMPSCVERLA